MPILHTIYDKQGVVYSALVGNISDADLLSSYKELYENKKWNPGFHEIVDMSNANMNEVTGKGLRQLSMLVEHYVSGKSQRFKTAIYAPNDLPYGLARLYKTISDETPEYVMIFKDLNTAIQWIGIDASIIQ